MSNMPTYETQLIWTDIKDAQPRSGEEVLACYFDYAINEPIMSLYTYYRKGDVVDEEVEGVTDEMIEDAMQNNNPFKKIAAKAKNDVELRFFASVFLDTRNVTVPSDGFYMYTSKNSGLGRWIKSYEPIEYWTARPITPYEHIMQKRL